MMRTVLTRNKTLLSKALLSLLAVTAAPLVAVACGGGDGEVAAEPPVTVVASTTHIADLAQRVGGERAEVIGLLAANADPHDYEPRPSDVGSVAESDLVLQSGGDLDLWLESVVESSGTDAPVVELIDSVETIEGEDVHGREDDGGHDDEHGDEGIDPHWWQDPTNAALAAGEIRDRLAAVDPEGRDEYEANAAAFIAELEELDAAIAECMDSIPARDRKLVTSHDSLGYFAERYEIDVVGAAIPALTTQAQPSAGETAELVDLIRDEGVRAVFPEAGISDRLERALAGETDAEVGGVLRADTLGPEGSGAETYLEATATNARTLATSFSGGEQTCPNLPHAE